MHKVDFKHLVAEADYISVHMPLNTETRGMFDARAFAEMKDGVRIFNCARGGIIDEAALVAALETGKVAAAGLDVYENEPLAKDSKLLGVDNLVLTPHLGASTKEAQESVGLEVAQQMVDVLNGGVVRNAINMPSIDAKTLSALRPYLDLGEALGAFVQQLGPECIEQLTISYYGKIVDLDALPLSRAIQRGYLRYISENVNDVNAPKKLSNLGIKVEVIKSSTDSEYTELIEVTTRAADGKLRSVAGTLFTKNALPRIVRIDGHGVEVNAQGCLLVLKNDDVPGIIGFIGNAMSEQKINIANMSLSRDNGQGFAISVYELDSVPSQQTQQIISEHEAIEKFKIIQL